MVRETCILKWPLDNLPFLYYFYFFFPFKNATPKQIDVAVDSLYPVHFYLLMKEWQLLPGNRKIN